MHWGRSLHALSAACIFFGRRFVFFIGTFTGDESAWGS